MYKASNGYKFIIAKHDWLAACLIELTWLVKIIDFFSSFSREDLKATIFSIKSDIKHIQNSAR